MPTQQPPTYDIFIAHASADTAEAIELRALLAPQLSAFVDAKDLPPGAIWDVELPSAQRASLVTVILLSRNTNDAWFQREEITSAIQLARTQEHRVVPVFLCGDEASVNIPYGLARVQAIRFDATSGLRGVAKALTEMFARLNPDRHYPQPAHDVSARDILAQAAATIMIVGAAVCTVLLLGGGIPGVKWYVAPSAFGLATLVSIALALPLLNARDAARTFGDRLWFRILNQIPILEGEALQPPARHVLLIHPPMAHDSAAAVKRGIDHAKPDMPESDHIQYVNTLDLGRLPLNQVAAEVRGHLSQASVNAVALVWNRSWDLQKFQPVIDAIAKWAQGNSERPVVAFVASDGGYSPLPRAIRWAPRFPIPMTRDEANGPPSVVLNSLLHRAVTRASAWREQGRWTWIAGLLFLLNFSAAGIFGAFLRRDIARIADTSEVSALWNSAVGIGQSLSDSMIQSREIQVKIPETTRQDTVLGQAPSPTPALASGPSPEDPASASLPRIDARADHGIAPTQSRTESERFRDIRERLETWLQSAQLNLTRQVEERHNEGVSIWLAFADGPGETVCQVARPPYKKSIDTAECYDGGRMLGCAMKNGWAVLMENPESPRLYAWSQNDAKVPAKTVAEVCHYDPKREPPKTKGQERTGLLCLGPVADSPIGVCYSFFGGNESEGHNMLFRAGMRQIALQMALLPLRAFTPPHELRASAP